MPAMADAPKPSPIKKEVTQILKASDKYGEDEVMHINMGQHKQNKKKRTHAQANNYKQQPETNQAQQTQKRRIKIDLTQNQTREFFSHGKVATMTLPESQNSKSP